MEAANEWLPELKAQGHGLYEQIVAGLEADIAAGKLSPGDRLPTHRRLADQLGCSVGTVTRAYELALRRGAVEARVGRGTFVRERQKGVGEAIDLSLNTPPQIFDPAQLRSTLSQLARSFDPAAFGCYAPNAGRPEHRAAAARWLSAHRIPADPGALILCNGAQHAIAIALGVVCRDSRAVLTEAATFHGMKSLALHAGYTLHGLAMDQEGLCPAALEEAAERGLARVLYTIPSLQNPTGTTLGAARRSEIVRIARKHDLTIVEDDVYSVLAQPGERTLAELAPERTFYVNSLSKALAPGLRVGFLIPPPSHFDASVLAMRATTWTSNPLGCLVMAQWMADGTAEAAIGLMREEAAQRTAIARSVFGELIAPGQRPTFHIWIPMASQQAERVAREALANGIAVTPPSAPIVDARAISGIRISLGSIAREELGPVLQRLRAIMRLGTAEPFII